MPNQRKEQKQRAVGSGFIIDSSGLVVTNHHVVHQADQIEVQLSDERTFQAKLIGSDKRTDLALLKLKKAKKLPTAKFGSSSKLRVGDHVVAIGNPFGLDHTVTSGIVSAKERVIGAGPYDEFIQTDASINPGNSGGPLFNLSGEVVGINTAIAPNGQGIGFAIPSDLAKGLISSLKGNGKIIRGWLGIAFQPLDEKLSKSFGISDKNGAVVTNITSGSPAETAGFSSGDVIISVNGIKLKSAQQLPSLVAKQKPGKTVPFIIIRNGKKKTIKVHIGQMPDERQGTPETPDKNEKEDNTVEVGFRVKPLDQQLKQRLGAHNLRAGIVVDRIIPGTSASEHLHPGDIIVEVNRDKVETIKQFSGKIKQLKPGDDLLLLIFRRGAWIYTVIRI